jgi:cytochrome c5
VRRAAWTIALGAALGSQAGVAQPSERQTAEYRVECVAGAACRADLATYIGWRVFQAQCATCHAADIRGSSFAPDLALRMSGMTQRQFFAALDHGYFGPESSMPSSGRSCARASRGTCRRDRSRDCPTTTALRPTELRRGRAPRAQASPQRLSAA